MRNAERPTDVVEGPDPAFSLGVRQDIVKAVLYVCPCGFVALQPDSHDGLIDMKFHVLWGHPAIRNPDLTCQSAPPWDHERWCIRPKGHEGDHWTPSINGGVGWSQW